MFFSNKYSKSSDQELINEYAQLGDSAAVGVLYQRYGHLVLGLCIKYLKNKVEAEDAVIQIFAKLLDDLKKYKITYFKSWLYVYSKNHCLMELRKRQSTLKKELEIYENAHLLVDFTDPEHLREREKQIELMELALDQLHTEQKKCIELFYLKNKSYREIMETTGYSTNDVKSYIQNGKRNLKIKIEALRNDRQTG